MKILMTLIGLLSISQTVFAADSFQKAFEAFLTHNDWYISRSADELTFFQVLKNENDALTLRTCPTYSNSESNGRVQTICADGLTVGANSKVAELNYDTKELEFVGKLPGFFSDEKIILKVNSNQQLQIQIGNKLYLPKDATGHTQLSM